MKSALKAGGLAAIAGVVALGYVLFGGGGDVSGGDARRLVAAGALLVDVRSPGEYAAGHIPGAVNIPVDELERRIGELESKEEPLVVYCRSGNRSARAARMLESAGYVAVHDLGAMSNW